MKRCCCFMHEVMVNFQSDFLLSVWFFSGQFYRNPFQINAGSPREQRAEDCPHTVFRVHYVTKAMDGGTILYLCFDPSRWGIEPFILHSIRETLTFWHWSFTFNSNKSSTRCKNFSVYYPDVCLQPNMFRAFSRLSSGAQ